MKNRLVSFWRDASDLRLKILSSLSNVINEYPAKGWIKQVVEEDDDFILFPWLEIEEEKTDVTYDYNDPSKAIARSSSSYIQLSVRDGRIEDGMVKRCKEFIKLLNYNRRYFNEYEIICLRKMWFNTVSPEVIIYIDFLYDISIGCNWKREQIKKMFYDGEILNDGQAYVILVRMKQSFFQSDHFDENHAEYYTEKNLDVVYGLSIDWSESSFDTPRCFDHSTEISCKLKLTNHNVDTCEFEIQGEFEVENGEIFFKGMKSFVLMDAFCIANETKVIVLKGHETKWVSCVFRSQHIISLAQNIPRDIEFVNRNVNEEEKFL